jgi:L-amino acid N-acyltransferase YncA
MEDPTAYFKTEMLVPDLEPSQHLILKDGETHATLYTITSAEQVPEGLAQYMTEEFNLEIESGTTYPHDEPMSVDSFRHYWFSQFAAILLIGDSPSLDPDTNWAQSFLGTFYIKPNYPGRCSHVCNAGFLVNSAIRGKGIGKTMGQLYLQLAPKLGYTYSVFNLVFETNLASLKIWDSLGFERIGRVKGAGKLRGHANKIDAIIFGKDLI